MKIKFSMMIGIILCLNLTLQAMVIHNYSEDKDKNIRTESGLFNEDYLFLGNELNFSGQAEDLIFLGKRLNFSGATQLGLISLCEDLIYSGKSGNGIIAGAMDIDVSGNIKGNNYIGCKSFTLSETSIVNGNIFIGCAKLVINGKLNGDLYAHAGELVINNEIQGNVFVKGGRVVIGDKGKIDGNLFYSAKEKLNEKDSSKVSGTITIDKIKKGRMDWNSFSKFKRSIGFLVGFGFFISYLVIGSLLLFLPAFRKLDAKQSAKTFWNTALWGLIPVLMYPAVIVFGILLIITIPLSVMLILAFLPLFFIVNIIGTTLTGKYLITKFKWNVEKRHYQFLIGSLACVILSMIPFVNFLLFVFICALGFGVFISFLFKKDLTIAE